MKSILTSDGEERWLNFFFQRTLSTIQVNINYVFPVIMSSQAGPQSLISPPQFGKVFVIAVADLLTIYSQREYAVEQEREGLIHAQ